MRVIIFGGDGYLGWPTAMNLSANGHDVLVVDNYLRRKIVNDLGCKPLVDLPDLHMRAEIWQRTTLKNIEVRIGDVCDYSFLKDVFSDWKPDAVVHYAEQPSAPYSMMGREEAALTINNNLSSTLNIIFAIRDLSPECHLVKLGTMGEYGTPDIDIEEGYLKINHKGRSDTFLFPKKPGSIYHLSKVQDSDMLYFAAKTWGLAVTDLNQGPVYGIETEEMSVDVRLAPNFSYDDVFGTVLNRFVVQAVVGVPLTVYGKGGQMRGYINLVDTLQCVELALHEPPEFGEFRVLNQFTETFTVKELAKRVQQVGNDAGLSVEVKNVSNPRNEQEDHYYNPSNTALLELGLKPHPLTDDVLRQMISYIQNYSSNIREDYIAPRINWSGKARA